MAKCLVVYITSLIVPVFFVGCSPAGLEHAEHVESESLKLAPVEAKPNVVESDEIIPHVGITDQLEPDKFFSASCCSLAITLVCCQRFWRQRQ